MFKIHVLSKRQVVLCNLNWFFVVLSTFPHLKVTRMLKSSEVSCTWTDRYCGAANGFLSVDKIDMFFPICQQRSDPSTCFSRRCVKEVWCFFWRRSFPCYVYNIFCCSCIWAQTDVHFFAPFCFYISMISHCLSTILDPVMQWQPLVKIHAGVPVEHSCGRHKSAVGTSHAKVATPTGNSYGKAYHILFHQQRCSTPTQWQPVVNIHVDPPNNLTEA